MDSRDSIATEVQSILSAARSRGTPNGRIRVRAKSLRGAFAASETAGAVPVIAEVKPTSPTTDGHREVDPVELAQQMVDGGASALSVLTEPDHFGGSADMLRAIRSAVDVPILRKDFILHEDQLDVVRADVVLLIVRFLQEDDTDDLATLIRAARDRGFQVLVEAHTREEVETAVEAGAAIIGVNNRDLGSLEVDLATFEDVAQAVPEGVTLIAESGIETREDVHRMRRAGADGLLIGSSIMEGDVRENTERLTAPLETDKP